MSKRHPKVRRVEVQWVDSTSNDRWEERSELLATRRKAPRCLSVGVVVADDKHGITLASSVHGSQVATTISIPRGAIKKVRRLR